MDPFDSSGVEAAATFGSAYYPIVTLYQLVLAALILRAGRLDAVRGGVALVLLVNAAETYSFAAAPLGLPAFVRGEELFRFDAILVLTLPYLASQIPGPMGGPGGARWARAAWLGGLAVWVLAWKVVSAPAEADAWLRIAVNPGALVVAGAILALHTVPAAARLPPGPLRVQSLYLAAGLAVGLAATGGAIGTAALRALPLAQGISALDVAMQAGYVLTLYFPLLMAAQAVRGARGARDALAFAALVLGGAGTGVLEVFTSLNANEFIHQSLRPLLIGIALLRYDFVQIPRALRRPLAAATAVMVVLAVFLLLTVAFAGANVLTTTQVGPLPILAAALVVALGVYAARNVAEDVFPLAGAGDPADAAARLERYRLALERRRQSPGGGDAELEQLRRSLGISAAQHQALAAVLERNVVIPSSALLGAQPGMVISGRYEVQRLLGQGGQGRALLAREVATDRLVVLKEVLRPWETGAADRRAALRREAAAASRVASPHLARVEGVVEEAWQTYLVREFVAGETLAEVVERRGRLPPAEAAAVARGVLAGLEALHRAGLACLDVKPANVVLAAGDRAVLIDQGTARAAGGDSGASAEATLGRAAGSDPFTARWAAPEQLRGGAVGPRTDVYQAAGLFVFLLTGEALEPGRKPPAGVPAAWRQALTRALAREPEKRFADAAAFRAALAPALRPPAKAHSR